MEIEESIERSSQSDFLPSTPLPAIPLFVPFLQTRSRATEKTEAFMHASNNFFRIIVALTLCLQLVSGMSSASRFGVPRTVPVGTVPQVISDFLRSLGMKYFFPHMNQP